MTCSQKQRRVSDCGTRMVHPSEYLNFTIAAPHPSIWGRFYPRKPPVSAPRFPQDQGVESKAKQTSTNPQRYGYLCEVLPFPHQKPSLMRRDGTKEELRSATPDPDFF